MSFEPAETVNPTRSPTYHGKPLQPTTSVRQKALQTGLSKLTDVYRLEF